MHVTSGLLFIKGSVEVLTQGDAAAYTSPLRLVYHIRYGPSFREYDSGINACHPLEAANEVALGSLGFSY